MDLPKAVNDLAKRHGGNGQAQRWVMRLLLVGVLAAVGWDLADTYIDGDVRSLFYQLIYWAFIALVGLLLWSSLKALGNWRLRLGLVGLVVLGVVLALKGTASEFPTSSTFSPDKWVDDAMTWMVEHWRGFFRGGLTVSLLKVLVPLEQRLLNVPWWLFIGVMTLLAWRVGRHRLALTTLASLLFLVFVGLWDQAMRTVAVVGTATIISVFLAIPLGIAMAKNRWFEAMMRPVLDTMQTMPSFVYLIPAIFFLGLGKVPAVLATMVYATPPAMRLTSLGIQLVSPELKEAARGVRNYAVADAGQGRAAASQAHHHGRCQPDHHDGPGYGGYCLHGGCPRAGSRRPAGHCPA